MNMIFANLTFLSLSPNPQKNLDCLQNGGLLGVPMGFLDFTPEPPAPSATPVTVTEHVDLSCNPSTDTRDLSSELLSVV